MMHGDDNFQRIIYISMDYFFDDEYRKYSSNFCYILESDNI
jgi:hypothetical protein